jgi:hypothetical protein
MSPASSTVSRSRSAKDSSRASAPKRKGLKLRSFVMPASIIALSMRNYIPKGIMPQSIKMACQGLLAYKFIVG